MQIATYNKIYQDYFHDPELSSEIESVSNFLLKGVERIFFIGNGGSNAVCAHMMEDYANMGKYQTFAFTESSMITCFANDYGYENAMVEWLKIYLKPDDVLVAISSSGNSYNIINAVEFANSIGSTVIGLSGFSPDNRLKGKGKFNFYIPVKNYGIVECFHQIILHIIIDDIYARK